MIKCPLGYHKWEADTLAAVISKIGHLGGMSKIIEAVTELGINNPRMPLQ